MNLTRAAITRPVFVIMLMAAALLLGTMGYRGMRLELNPEVNFGVVTVNTVYPGAGPEEINTLVTRKIEEAVSGVAGLREVTGASQEGFSTVVATFELETDVNEALNDVRSRVDGILNQLPDDIEKPQVTKFDNSAQPVLYLAMTSRNLSSQQLRDLIDDRLQDRFAQIPGVASAAVQGGDVREIQVRLNRAKLLGYGIGPGALQRQIQAATLNVPAGRAIYGEREFTVRVPLEFATVNEIRNMRISIANPKNPMAKGTSVVLSDVAEVVDATRERTSYARLNGSDTIVLALLKAREGNAVEIGHTADKLVKQISTEYAAQGIQITKTFEQGKQIEESLADLNFTLFFAILLVSAIVWIFLHSLRGTIIVALAIPTSIFATFAVLKVLGFTINNMTMLALILAVGVLVDDAIVVLENIFRHLKMGEDPRDAALNGRGEIGMAAMAITFADVVVFLPIAFMGGVVGQFFRPMAWAYVTAVLFSLFTSFTLTPMLASRWFRRGEDMEEPHGRFAHAFERMFARLENAYRRALEWSLQHRWFVFISGNIALLAVFMFIGGSFKPDVGAASEVGLRLFPIAIVIGIVTLVINLIRGRFRPVILVQAALFGLVFPLAAVLGFAFAQWKDDAAFKIAFFPASDTGQVTANIELPPGTSLATTQRAVAYVEGKMAKDPDVKYVLSNVGTQGVGNFSGSSSGSSYAQVVATLYDKQAILDRLPWKEHKERLRTRADTAVAAKLTQEVGRFPGAQVRVAATSAFGFGAPIQLSFTSDDRTLLLNTLNKIRQGLASGAIKGVYNVDVTAELGKPELRVKPDRTLLTDLGVDVATVAGALRTLYEGDEQTKFRVNGREYNIRVQLREEDRYDPEALAALPVAFVQGHPVYLGSVAKIEEAPGVSRIDRRNRQEEAKVTADLLPGYAQGTVQAQIETWLKKESLVPPGVQTLRAGQAEVEQRETGFMLSALGIGILLVYMLLAALYDNLLYPFLIQLATPQAITGAILALVITDKPFGLVGFIGVITLMGLVGKNAILLVDYTNTLRDRGRDRHDALVEAGPTRLRPIMMTTLALILGTLPIALAVGRGSEFRETIGITIIGGIVLSTLLTLLVIPCSYTIFDDLSSLIGRGMAKLTGGRR